MLMEEKTISEELRNWKWKKADMRKELLEKE